MPGGSHPHYEEEPEPEPPLYHLGHNYEEGSYGPAPLLEGSSWARFGVSDAGQAFDLSPVHNGDDFVEGDAPAQPHPHTQGQREVGWGSPWTESEEQMAEALLFAIRQD
jgi:hypothetical protein